jgi:signal peptidase I
VNQRAERTRARRTGSRWIPFAWVGLGVVALAVAVLAIAGGGDGGSGAGGAGANANLQTYEMPSNAMAPIYVAGSRIEVNQGAYAGAEPQVGDVVVFHPPGGPGKRAVCGTRPKPGEPCPRPAGTEASRIAIERVVAGPGDTLSIAAGNPVVNGAEESLGVETQPCGGAACDLPRTIRVRAGEYFMLGDNRQTGDDSRSWGPVPVGWIIGKVE